jgi:hypothetical protein
MNKANQKLQHNISVSHQMIISNASIIERLSKIQSLSDDEIKKHISSLRTAVEISKKALQEHYENTNSIDSGISFGISLRDTIAISVLKEIVHQWNSEISHESRRLIISELKRDFGNKISIGTGQALRAYEMADIMLEVKAETEFEKELCKASKIEPTPTHIKTFEVIEPTNDLESVGELLELSHFGEYCPKQSLRGYSLQSLLSQLKNYRPKVIIQKGEEINL